jgi:hypothetical protein
MKIEKTPSRGILFTTKKESAQVVYFDNEEQRNVIFEYWNKAIAELNKSKAIYRPVYEGKDGDTQILKLRYTTPEEVIEVDKAHKLHFSDGNIKLIMIYNEQERTFQNVNN